jgi:hypothetical protein
VPATLKACKKLAQGTALGNRTDQNVALEGHNKLRMLRIILPFQGGVVVGVIPQGGALGCLLTRFQRSRQDPLPNRDVVCPGAFRAVADDRARQ